MILAGAFCCGSIHAGQTVVDAGTTFTFTVPAISTNYAWRMEGTLVSTNGIVGTNGPNFTYAPTRFDVGTHELACYQTLLERRGDEFILAGARADSAAGQRRQVIMLPRMARTAIPARWRRRS